MSNRQQRNRRKARRRRDKLLEMIDATQIDGMTVRADLFDYGHILAVSIHRHADNSRHAARVVADRLWRRMDDVPERMLERLLIWHRCRPVEPAP